MEFRLQFFSTYIISSKNYLKNTIICSEQIVLPNSKVVLSYMCGSFFGYLNNTKFILKDVFCVPDITKNMISVSKLIQQYKVVFFIHNNKPCSTIYDEHGKRISNIYSNNQNVYILWLTNIKNQLESIIQKIKWF